MNRKYEWIAVFVIILFFILIIYFVKSPTLCYTSCNQKGFAEGYCMSMSEKDSCETKFNYTSLSKDFCRQKNPEGYHFNCCCK
jgi:hypothetical protein